MNSSLAPFIQFSIREEKTVDSEKEKEIQLLRSGKESETVGGRATGPNRFF